MSDLRKKIACCTQSNQRLNRRALCMKRSWDEVSFILQHVCRKKGKKGCCK